MTTHVSNHCLTGHMAPPDKTGETGTPGSGRTEVGEYKGGFYPCISVNDTTVYSLSIHMAVRDARLPDGVLHAIATAIWTIVLLADAYGTYFIVWDDTASWFWAVCFAASVFQMWVGRTWYYDPGFTPSTRMLHWNWVIQTFKVLGLVVFRGIAASTIYRLAGRFFLTVGWAMLSALTYMALPRSPERVPASSHVNRLPRIR